MIRKLKSGKYKLYSRKKNPKTRQRRNLGTFTSRKAAEKHERSVQFFKRYSISMGQIANSELGPDMPKRVEMFRQLLAQTPADELEVRESPSVQLRVSDYTWLEAIVRYIVPPKEAGRVKTRLIKQMLAQLNAAPDRALFRKSNSRQSKSWSSVGRIPGSACEDSRNENWRYAYCACWIRNIR